MSDAGGQLLEQVLRLPAGERARLAHELLASIDEPDTELSADWADELEQRLDSDSSHDRPAAEVMAELDRKYGFT